MFNVYMYDLFLTDGKAYVCGVCSTSFRRKDNLDRHVQNSHPGNKVPHIKRKVKVHKEAPIILPATNVVDNPNAIKVITSSVSQENKKEEKKHINAPLKLAFKTSAFKSCYNIHR